MTRTAHASNSAGAFCPRILHRLAQVALLTVALGALPLANGAGLLVTTTPEAAGVLRPDLVVNTPAAAAAAEAAAQERVLAQYGRLPLAFEAGASSSERQSHFSSHGSGYHLLLRPTEAVLWLQPADARAARASSRRALATPDDGASAPDSVAPTALALRLVGANTGARLTGEATLPGKVNRFLGSDPSQWRTDLSLFGRVRGAEVYPGIDVVYYGNQRQLEFDFVVAPGATTDSIRLGFAGADRVTLASNGDLLVEARGGQLRQQRPEIYQDGRTGRKTIAGQYVLAGANEVRFQIGDYDHTRPLVIDPVLSYATFLGGLGADKAWDVAVDGEGNAYLTGETRSTTFTNAPTGGFQTTNYGSGLTFGGDAFVAKLNSNGTALVYFTYLGGTGVDGAFTLAVDPDGNAYLGGYTTSTNFPITAGAFQPTLHGTPNLQAGTYQLEAFVTKLNPAGNALVFSTYLGGTGEDDVIALGLDAARNVYVTGKTTSTNFPSVTNVTSLQSTNAGGKDAYVAKLSADGSALIYATYLGGTGDEDGEGLAVGADGSVTITGLTTSTNFPTAHALWSTNSGLNDAFVAKLTPDGATLVYSTYLGGENNDYGSRVALDSAGNAVLVGQTYSTNFPTFNALQATNAGSSDAFVTKLSADGSAVLFSTYLGGEGPDVGWALALDVDNNIYLTGQAYSTNFPGISTNFLQYTNQGSIDAVVAELNAAGTAVVFATFLGGTSQDIAYGIRVDAAGNIYVTGQTSSTDFPATTNSVRTVAVGLGDAFVVKYLNPPTVSAAMVGEALVVSWPAPTPEFRLQSADTTSGTNWTFDAHVPLLLHGRNTVTTDASEGRKFYRLIRAQ